MYVQAKGISIGFGLHPDGLESTIIPVLCDLLASFAAFLMASSSWKWQIKDQNNVKII